MPGADRPPHLARFESFELDVRAGELRPLAGEPVRLPEQSLRILVLLLEHPGEVVQREEIQKKLWPNDTIVEFEHSISAAMNRLRQALGDSAEKPKYVETLARRGYRWMVPVAWAEGSAAVQPRTAEEKKTAKSSDGKLIGKKISHYRVLGILGGGGMGVVYEAEDLKLGRRVALKFLPEELASDSAVLQRFESEARSASALNHPNICTIYGIEEYEGQPFLVMELLEGQTLRDLIVAMAPGNSAVGLANLLDLAVQITAGLEAAHRQGIIHRDIKPANIFVTSHGQAKILDFGLAKLSPTGPAATGSPPTDDPPEGDSSFERQHGAESLTASSPFLSRAGVAMGTAGYMSPEQVRGEKLDARTDLFSFGLVLYEMATGKRAFEGSTGPELQEAILTQMPSPARKVNLNLPRELEEIIGRALEKDRDVRYQSASEIRTDLQRLKRDSESARVPAATTAVVGVGERRGIRWKVIVPAAITFVALAVGSYFIFHRTPKLTDKDTIVLAEFTNTTGDSVFDDTLKQALAVDLGQSPFLNILSEEKVHQTLQEMTRSPSERLTRDFAREVCQRAGSKAYLVGSIAALGTQYVIGLEALNCASGDVLAREQVTAAGKEQVLPVLGQAASTLRNEVGESLSSVQKFDVPLEQATTNSLEALKAYTLGQRAAGEKGDTESIPFYKRAIELDPNFAMAYVALGIEYSNLNHPSLAADYMKKAFDLRDRVTEREKFNITAHFYDVATGELERANQAYELWIQVYPRDFLAYLDLGSDHMTLGQYDKAAAETREVLRLEPTNAVAYSNLGEIYLALNRFDEARTTTEEALGRKLDHIALHLNLYALAFFQGNVATMKQQADWAIGKPGTEDWMLSVESDTEAWSGKLGKARDLSRQAVGSARRGDEKEPAALWQANAAIREALFGNAEAARQNAAAAVALALGSHDAEAQAALAYALAGDVAHAQSLADDLAKRFPQDTVVQSLWLPTIHAQIKTSRKNPARSIELLQAAAPYELGMLTGSAPNSCLYPVYVRAEAYLSAQHSSEAVAEFQKILDHRGLLWNCATGSLAHLGLARAYTMQGDTSKAKAAYQDFLMLWKDADPDVPIFIAAKSEYAKLQ